MKRVAALLLSAGKGERALGLKPFLQWNGESFVRKVFRSLEGSQAFHEIVVVTGHEPEKVELELEGFDATFAYNPGFGSGMLSSIKAGLTALSPGWDGAMVALVDQPHLDADDYKRLARAFANSQKLLLRPKYDGKFGNPAVIGAEFLDEILAEPDCDRGCSFLFSRHPDKVMTVEMNSDKCLVDFDSREQLDSYAGGYL
jgi:molybdenum cofactor cytidylyltransferase